VVLTTLHLFRLRLGAVPAAVVRAAADPWRPRTRGGCGRRVGVRFAKVLGTGDGQTFTLRDADPLRWGLLCVWDDEAALAEFEGTSPVAAGWRRSAREVWRAELALIHSRGRWAQQEPFGEPWPQAKTGRWQQSRAHASAWHA
jgi:hypothetical protein